MHTVEKALALAKWGTTGLRELQHAYRVRNINKFGATATAGTSETVIVTGNTTTFLTAAKTIEVVSSSTADTAAGNGCRTLTIFGCDSDFNEISEVITTNGQSDSADTSQSFLRVYRARCTTTGTYHGANTGDITVKTSDDEVMLVMPAGRGSSETSVFTTFVNTKAYITQMKLQCAPSGSATGNLFLNIHNGVDVVSVPFNSRRTEKAFRGLTNVTQEFDFDSYIEVPEKSDIWLSAIFSTGTTNVMSADYSFRLLYFS